MALENHDWGFLIWFYVYKILVGVFEFFFKSRLHRELVIGEWDPRFGWLDRQFGAISNEDSREKMTSSKLPRAKIERWRSAGEKGVSLF